MSERTSNELWNRSWEKKSDVLQLDFMSQEIFRYIAHYVPIKGKTSIELGCGLGRLSYMMAEAGAAEVALVDFSEKALHVARELLAGRKNASFIQGDFLDMQRQEKYDIVFSSGVIEHFKGDALVQVVKQHRNFSKDYVVFVVPSDTFFNNRRSVQPENLKDVGYQFPMGPKHMEILCNIAKLDIVVNRKIIFSYGFPLPSMRGRGIMRYMLTRIARPLDMLSGGLTLTICKV
ncbi:class I SAM-dependent methyltransferase [Thiovibrio sp. JS02]